MPEKNMATNRSEEDGHRKEDCKNNSTNDGKVQEKGPSQSEVLLDLCGGLSFFHDTDGAVFVNLPVENHFEFVSLKSKFFKDWLSHKFYRHQRKAPSREPMTAAIGVLSGHARYESPEVIPHIRLARHEGSIYLDLCNTTREVVRIDSFGWEVLQEYPVFFRRPKGMLPLPTPKKGGSITEFKRYLNVKDEHSWRLIVAWVVQSFNPDGPYPILVINGEQGTAKSTGSKFSRSIIDPNVAPLRSLPRSERDLAISCSNSWVQVLENVSYLPDWLSDALCRLSTGGGFSTRTLYANDEETLFSSKRPIVLNGICNFVTRHDLADRSLMVHLEPIPDEKRLPESRLMARFEKSAPFIIGAFLDAVSEALKNIETTTLERLPRMADFALWVTAAEPALPWNPGGFMRTYDAKRAETVRDAVESSPVGSAILKLMEDRDIWEGTPSELLAALEAVTDEKTQKLKTWPGNARWLSERLNETSSFLRKIGIDTYTDRSGKKRHTRIAKNSVTCVTNVISEQKQKVTGDATDDATNSKTNSVTNSVTQKGQLNQGFDANDANDAIKHINGVWVEGEI